jgi:hypothetical protein
MRSLPVLSARRAPGEAAPARLGRQHATTIRTPGRRKSLGSATSRTSSVVSFECADAAGQEALQRGGVVGHD